MPFWLVKTEPSTYAFADLSRDRKTLWDGVSNPQAQASLRAMRPGDAVLVYHSGDRVAVGLARVAALPVPDPGDASGRRVAVALSADRPLPAPVPLEALRSARAFAGSPLLRQGRLSVLPLTGSQWKAVLALAAAGPHSEKRSRTSTRVAPASPGSRRRGSVPSR